MRGTMTIHFTTLVADSILEHGTGWAWRYYAKRLPLWELRFWWGTPTIGRAMIARACYERSIGV